LSLRTPQPDLKSNEQSAKFFRASFFSLPDTSERSFSCSSLRHQDQILGLSYNQNLFPASKKSHQPT